MAYLLPAVQVRVIYRLQSLVPAEKQERGFVKHEAYGVVIAA